jgi:phage terminase large subunit-like protein
VKRIRHDGNPVMAWCVSNAEPKYDRYENLWVEKPSSTKRIDGLIAAVMAINQLIMMPEKPKSVYETRGALVL